MTVEREENNFMGVVSKAGVELGEGSIERGEVGYTVR